MQLEPVKNETGVIYGAYDSGVLKQDVRSKSYSSFAIYSLRLALKEGKLVAENQKSIDELRAGLNKMFQDGSMKFSGDQICPKDSTGIILLAIKDAFVFPFCVAPQR